MAKVAEKQAAERDRLWHRVFDAIYDSLYYEIELGTYIRRLEFLNTAGIALASVTGAGGIGALIAKQTVWKTPGGEWVWAALLVIAAITEGARRALDPAKKIPLLQDLIGSFIHLRSDLEELRSIMKADYEFDVPATQKQYNASLKRCIDLTKNVPVSFLLHVGVRRKCQKETTDRLADYL